MKTPIKHAVIPVAGLGTRFLPATKSVPKELLPIIDRPILLHIVEEAVLAGIEVITFISGRGKSAIEDFFDTSFELETVLANNKQPGLYDEIIRIKNLCEFVSVRQKEAKGLGHAVFCAREVIGNRPFAVLLGDEIVYTQPNEPTATGQLCTLYQKSSTSTVAVMPVAEADVSKYGIIKYSEVENKLLKVEAVVEKPSPQNAPSRFALPGRYVFNASLFDHLADTQPGKNGEIQLTDAMTSLAQTEGLFATEINGKRYDAGDRLGYLQANVEYGLRDPRFSAEFKKYLLNLTSSFKG